MSLVAQQFDEVALCARMRAGNGEALRVVVGHLSPNIEDRLNRIFRNKQLAEEAVNEATARLWRSMDRFVEGPGKLEPYYFQIAFNEALQILRQGRRKPRILEAVTEDTAVASDQLGPVELEQLVRDLEAALAKLTPRSRAIMLRKSQGVSSASIAAQFGTTAGVIDQAVHRARRTLRNELSETGWLLGSEGLL